MAYKGTPLYTEDEDLFEAMQIARECGLLVLVHAENGDAIAKLQAQALARGDTVAEAGTGCTRPEAVEAEATNRAIRLAEVADCPLLVVHVSCAASLEEIKRAHARGRPVYAETCPQYLVFSDERPRAAGLRGREVRALAAAARRVEPAGAVARASSARTCTSSARTTARSTSAGRRSWARTTSR